MKLSNDSHVTKCRFPTSRPFVSGANLNNTALHLTINKIIHVRLTIGKVEIDFFLIAREHWCLYENQKYG